MNKDWICLLCHRSGSLSDPFPAVDEPGFSRADLARKQHFAQLASDEQINKRMAVHHPGFVGPSTECNGDIKLREPRQRVETTVTDSGTLGGDEPWI